MIYIALFLKIKDLRGFSCNLLQANNVWHLCQFGFFFFLILSLTKYSEVIDLQLKLNCIK
jgi:hypothetical protein